jgi:hypothetical protein
LTRVNPYFLELVESFVNNIGLKSINDKLVLDTAYCLHVPAEESLFRERGESAAKLGSHAIVKLFDLVVSLRDTVRGINAPVRHIRAQCEVVLGALLWGLSDHVRLGHSNDKINAEHGLRSDHLLWHLHLHLRHGGHIHLNLHLRLRRHLHLHLNLRHRHLNLDLWRLLHLHVHVRHGRYGHFNLDLRMLDLNLRHLHLNLRCLHRHVHLRLLDVDVHLWRLHVHVHRLVVHFNGHLKRSQSTLEFVSEIIIIKA